MFPEGVGGDVGIFSAAGVEQLVMGFAGHVQIARENQMQAGVPVAIVVQSLEKESITGRFAGEYNAE